MGLAIGSETLGCRRVSIIVGCEMAAKGTESETLNLSRRLLNVVTKSNIT